MNKFQIKVDNEQQHILGQHYLHLEEEDAGLQGRDNQEQGAHH